MLTLQAAKAFSSLTALVLLVYLVTIFFTGFIQRRRNHSKKMSAYTLRVMEGERLQAEAEKTGYK